MTRFPPSKSVVTFFESLATDRRREVEILRNILRRSVPAGFEETISKNMLVYQVPLHVYPDTYNKHPLWYVALASEKSDLSLHLLPIYGNQQLTQVLKDGFKAAGKKLDMDKRVINPPARTHSTRN